MLVKALCAFHTAIGGRAVCTAPTGVAATRHERGQTTDSLFRLRPPSGETRQEKGRALEHQIEKILENTVKINHIATHTVCTPRVSAGYLSCSCVIAMSMCACASCATFFVNTHGENLTVHVCHVVFV